MCHFGISECTYLGVMRLLFLSLLRNVIFSCIIENNLFIACSIQIKYISL